MTAKVQKDWPSIRDELNARLQLVGNDYLGLSVAAGVSYHAARRYVLNGAQNRTGTARKLCDHFCIALDETAKLQERRLQDLTTLVEQVCDGSEPHAELLASLIRSTRAFTIQERHNSH